MTSGGTPTDVPICPECGGRHEPGDFERCELILLYQRASDAETVEPEDDPYSKEAYAHAR